MKKGIRLLALLTGAVLILSSCSGGGVSQIPEKDIREAESIGSFSEGIAYITLKNGKQGYIDASGKTIAEAKWDDTYSFQNGAAIVKVKESEDVMKYGVIDKTGKTIIEPKWDDISRDSDSSLFIVTMKKGEDQKTCQVLNAEGKQAFAGEWDSLSFASGLLLASKDGKYGYLSETGETVIPFEYTDAGGFSDDGFAKVKKDGLWGLIDRQGNVLVAPSYEEMKVSDNQIWVKTTEGHYCRIKKDGSVIVDLTSMFDNINLLASKNKADMEIDLFDPSFIALSDDSTSVSVMIHTVAVSGTWLNFLVSDVLLVNNREVVLPFLDKGYVVSGLSKGAKGQYIARLNPLGIDPKYNSSKKLEIKYDEKACGLIDSKGDTIAAPGRYESISYNEKLGMYAVKMNGLYGFMNADGDLVVYPYYDSYNSLSDGLMAVKKGSLWGYIDRAGNVIIPVQYQKARTFDGGYAAVQDHDGWHIIDTSGKVVY